MKRVFCLFFIVALWAPGAAFSASAPLQVGTGIDYVYLPYYVAQDAGFYTKQGFDAKTKLFSWGGEALNAVMAGEMELTSTAEPTTMIPFSKGANILIAATSCQAGNTIKLVTRSEIKSPQDLAGKKIGVIVNASQDYYLGKYLEYHRIPVDKVKAVSIQPPEAVALLERGDIDGFVLHEPWPARAMEISGNKVHILARSGDNSIYIPTLFIVLNRTYAEKNPEGAKKVVRAIIEASEFIKNNPDKAAEIGAKNIHVKVDEAKKLIPEFGFRVGIDKFTVDSMKEVAQWLKQRGAIKEEINFEKLIQPQYLKEVDPSRITY
jgi:NitT/TauT family transport system substrate-binding protein